eukprot:gene11549-11341_t
MIEARGIRKAFGQVSVLRNVSLTVGQGEVVALIGPSGSGKSTFLRCLNHLETIDRGHIAIEGQALAQTDAAGRCSYASEAEFFAAPGHERSRAFLNHMLVILRDVSLQVPRGKVTALMGASGGGKTTVLRLIGGQQRAQHGQVLFDGQEVGRMDTAGLFAHTDLSEALIRDVVLMKLNAVGLRGARDLMPSQISGGMARRVALARAIALDPELIMYDEPFAGLDPISLGTTAQLIRQLNDAMGLTSVLVSHDLAETFRLADHVIILGAGVVAAQGTPAEVMASTDPLVHHVGFAVRSKLADVGHGARLFARLLQLVGAVFARPALVRDQVHFLGNYSLAIIAVSGLFVGFVLGLQGYYTLQRYGSSEALGLLVALSLVRELGPVVTALLFAGRAGTSLTAEIGLMRAGEQLSAMEMMAVDPVRRILAPRFWAGVITMPLLAAVFSAVGVIGGWVVGVLMIGIDPGAFWSQMQGGVDVWKDVGNGVLKSLVFGFTVTFVALLQGFVARPTPEGVARATTRTVVIASLSVLALDFVLTALMFSI